MASREQLDEIVDTHLRAVRDCDIETILATVTDDVEYDLVGTSQHAVRGRDAVRAHHNQEFANIICERAVPLRRLYGEGFVVDESVWEGRVTGRVGTLVGNGRRVSQRVLRVFEMRGERIARESVYSDFAALSRQLP